MSKSPGILIIMFLIFLFMKILQVYDTIDNNPRHYSLNAFLFVIKTINTHFSDYNGTYFSEINY